MTASIRRLGVHLLLCLSILVIEAGSTSPEIEFRNPVDQGLAVGGGASKSLEYNVWSIIGSGVDCGTSRATEFRADSGLAPVLSNHFGDPFDLNVDGVVNEYDFFVFSSAWGKYEGQNGYRRRADLNGNSIIGNEDLLLYKSRTRR